MLPVRTEMKHEHHPRAVHLAARRLGTPVVGDVPGAHAAEEASLAVLQEVSWGLCRVQSVSIQRTTVPDNTKDNSAEMDRSGSRGWREGVG